MGRKKLGKFDLGRVGAALWRPTAAQGAQEATRSLKRAPKTHSDKNCLQKPKNGAQYTTKARKIEHDPPPDFIQCPPHDLQSGTAQQTNKPTEPQGYTAI